jgi:hypothetical protein
MGPQLISTAGTLFLMLLMFSSQLLAHGVEGTVQPGGLTVTCQYSNGEAMSYAKVTILPPGMNQPFQVGHTDKNGHICFFPDALEEWRVTADDGMGHKLEVKVPVTNLEGMKQILPPPGAAGVSDTRNLRVLTGLPAIFGLSGFLFWFVGSRLKRGRKEG